MIRSQSSSHSSGLITPRSSIPWAPSASSRWCSSGRDIRSRRQLSLACHCESSGCMGVR